MKKGLFVIILFFSFQPAFAYKDTAFISFLMNRILEQQIQSANHPHFMKGLVPGYVGKQSEGYSEEIKDNNTSILLVLDMLDNTRSRLNPYQKTLLDTIRSRSLPSLKKFENKFGRGTINFWRQDQPHKFPYNWWVPFFFGDRWRPPDDFDDTSIFLMVSQADSNYASTQHKIMQNFSGYPSERVVGCPKEYKSIGAYSTWYGKKFPVFFDLVVASNTLRFVQHFNLNWTKADSATLNFIVKSIETNDYFTQFHELAPYYENRAIILYAFSNLMAKKSIPALEKYKQKLIQDAFLLLKESDNLLEKIILCISIQKLGGTSPSLELPSKENILEEIEKNDLPFFTGNMLNYFEGNTRKVLKFLFKDEMYKVHFCPAYNIALLLEYLSL